MGLALGAFDVGYLEDHEAVGTSVLGMRLTGCHGSEYSCPLPGASRVRLLD